MKKEDLTALGLTEEQITEIQRLNGLDIKKEQEKVSKVELERDNYKGQLDTAQDALKKFDGVDVEQLKGEITKLNTDLQTKESEYQSKLSDMTFSQSIEAAIAAAGGKNVKAVKALLDMETLKSSKNQEADIKSALETCQKDNDYLFGANEPFNNPVAPTGGGLPKGEDAQMAAMMAAMGIPQTTK
jgi:hypothetical protein